MPSYLYDIKEAYFVSKTGPLSLRTSLIMHTFSFLNRLNYPLERNSEETAEKEGSHCKG